jgi:hypothetical protein
MSIHWDLHCKTCNVMPTETEDFNYSQHILRSIYRLREHIIAICEQGESGYPEIHTMAYSDVSNIWSFFRKHKNHEIDLLSEYGDVEPVVEVGE